MVDPAAFVKLLGVVTAELAVGVTAEATGEAAGEADVADA
jgi:hypothetical protein